MYAQVFICLSVLVFARVHENVCVCIFVLVSWACVSPKVCFCLSVYVCV